MDWLHIFYAGFLGTTLMTLFSYALSYATGDNYKEPKNLAMLICDFIPPMQWPVCHFLGWVAHYLVGFGFVLMMAMAWHFTSLQPTILNGLWMGAVCGLTGIVWWHITLTLHPLPDMTSKTKYYLQLLIAHIIFGAFAVIGFGSGSL